MAVIYLKREQLINTSQGTYTVGDFYNKSMEDANILDNLCLPAFDLDARKFYDVKVDMVEDATGTMDTLTITVGDNYSHPWDIVIHKEQKLYDIRGEIDPYTIIPGNQVITDNGMVPVKHLRENQNSVDLVKFTLDAKSVFVDKILVKTIEANDVKEEKKSKKKSTKRKNIKDDA